MIRTDIRLWLCTEPTDMRKSYNGLAALVRQYFRRTPHCGDGFVFINRRQTQLKCLYFEHGGFCIWAKRLEQGRYRQHSGAAPVALSATEFAALVEGFDVVIQRRRKRTSPGNT